MTTDLKSQSQPLMMEFLQPTSNTINITGNYIVPTKGFLSYLPKAWVPYAELMRLNKPIGTLNIFFPYLFGALFAACITHDTSTPSSILATNAHLFIMALVLRSAGCVWNDVNDRDLDKKVARCCIRPVARGALTPRQAYALHAVLIVIWLLMLSRTNEETVQYAFATLVLGHFYPFAKRFTDFPRVVLGLTLSTGLPVGCALQGLSPTLLVKESRLNAVPLVCLCYSYLMWTTINDVIYGFQDKLEDAKAGVKSMCLRFEACIIVLLIGLSTFEIFFHVATGLAMGAGLWYYVGTSLGTTILVGMMIMKADLEDPKECLWWFQFECLAIGWTIAAGLGGEYMRRRLLDEHKR